MWEEGKAWSLIWKAVFPSLVLMSCPVSRLWEEEGMVLVTAVLSCRHVSVCYTVLQDGGSMSCYSFIRSLLVHSPNVHTSLGCARLEPELEPSVGGKDPHIWAITYLLLSRVCLSMKLKLAAGLGFEPWHSRMAREYLE